MDSHKLARVIADAINAHTFEVEDLPTFQASLRLRELQKVQDITGLAVHVIPVPPESAEVVDRRGDVQMLHRVGVVIYDRLEPGENDPDTQFDWSEKRIEFAYEIVKGIDWNAAFESSDSVLSDFEFNDESLYFANADSVFAWSILFIIETSE